MCTGHRLYDMVCEIFPLIPVSLNTMANNKGKGVITKKNIPSTLTFLFFIFLHS